MGKVDDNKKQKKHTLLRAAFQLFTEKGFSKTTVADIVDRAGLAKGTFYLYFKDKFDLRDKLIAYKATQLFNDAHLELDKANVPTFEDEVLFMTDYIIGRFMTDEPLIQFVAKNLSWGIFQAEVSNGASVLPQAFFDHYLESLERYHVNCTSPSLMLYTIIELIGSTSYSCILKQTPVSMAEYMPYLHETLKKIIEVFTVKEDAE
ncbi:MAG: TetR/AcrR family transcriptional regulator [Dorea sp.]